MRSQERDGIEEALNTMFEIMAYSSSRPFFKIGLKNQDPDNTAGSRFCFY